MHRDVSEKKMFVLLKRGLKQKNGVITYFVQQGGSKPLFLTPSVCSTCSIRDLFPSAKMAEQTHTQHTSGELTNTALIIFPFHLIVRISAGVGEDLLSKICIGIHELHVYTYILCLFML